ncbi:Hypothetical protein D9617_6g095130 [Elsinoe fawcettii]|nr:Hypothetical protein D9617_6g095130 [Elsinoe fawcettii]
MSSPNAPRNRKTRRADAKSSGQKFRPLESASSIPMAQPDRSGPKTRTLFDIAAERNDLLAKGQPFSPVHGDGLVRDENGRVVLPAKEYAVPGTDDAADDAGDGEDGGEEEVVGPLGEAVFYTITLSMLHFTLNLLVHNQYATEPPTLSPLAVETASTMPFLGLFIYILKLRWWGRRKLLKQGVHFVLGTVAGCYLLYVGNRENYLAVMKRAPSLGTFWVWNVVEMRLELAVVSLLLCGAYLWWNEFSVM